MLVETLQSTPSIRLKSSTVQLDTLVIDNHFANVQVSLFGGQILNYRSKLDGRERLWLSPDAVLNGSKPIRGGIPVCWPWFGNHSGRHYQAHGYVRSRLWQLINCSENALGTSLTLAPSTSSGLGFSGQAKLSLLISVGAELKIELITENTGTESFDYTCALHSYFKVEDIRQTELLGLSGDYSDKTLDWANGTTPSPYTFTAETDRIHLNPVNQTTIISGTDTTIIHSSGHDSLVVWNPWEQRAKEIGDMSNEGYLHMLCVETAITQGKNLQPGESHSLSQSF